jgi:hypothetical protein
MKRSSLLLVCGFAFCAVPSLASAQATPTVPQTGVPNVFNQGPNTAGMTPAQAQQAQRIWQLRALQSRGGQGGGSGPKRGYPQFIGSGPFGGGGGGAGAPATNNQATQAPAKPTSQQKAAQRRAEAKADIEARKQQMRADNEQKKQQNANKN